MLLKEVVLQRGNKKRLCHLQRVIKTSFFPPLRQYIVFSAGSGGKAPFGKSGSICHEAKGWSLREDVHSVEVYGMTRSTYNGQPS